jgi:hypothetical protein
MIRLRPDANILAELAFGNLAAGGSGKLVDHDESFGQQLLGNSQRQQVLDELRQVDGPGVGEFGVEANLFTEPGSGIATAAATAIAGWVVTASSTWPR